MADFTPEQISAAISRAADYIENADGNVCLEEGEAEHIIAAFRTHAPALADMAKRMEAAQRDAAYGRALQSAMEAEYQAAKESRKGGKQEAWITTYTLLRRLKVAADHLTTIAATQEGETVQLTAC